MWDSDRSKETNLSIGDKGSLKGAFILCHGRLPGRNTEDVGGDDRSVKSTLYGLLLFGPIDYIATCKDVGMGWELQSGLDLDEAFVGQSTWTKG